MDVAHFLESNAVGSDFSGKPGGGLFSVALTSSRRKKWAPKGALSIALTRGALVAAQSQPPKL